MMLQSRLYSPSGSLFASGQELEVSLLAVVATLLGVLVLPAVVGVDIITWVVSVGLSIVQVYMQRMLLISACACCRLHTHIVNAQC